MFKITSFLSPWLLWRNTKLHDLENQGQGYFPLMTLKKLLNEPFSDSLACLHLSAEELYCYNPGVPVVVHVRVHMQNVRANVN